MSTVEPGDEEEQEIKPRYVWPEYIERLATPKRRVWPRPKTEPTQWQKRGPMAKRDWIRFMKWAQKNAVAKEELPPVEITIPRCFQPVCKKPTTPHDLELKIEKLSMPLDRFQRSKYQSVKEVFHYSPKISATDPPQHDPGRPFLPPKVPKCFPNGDIEGLFWHTLRFPVRDVAMKYKPNARIKQLAQPRVTPPAIPHCPIPVRLEEQPMPRSRFKSRRRWLEHQLRLEYLAKPVVRNTLAYYYL